MKKILVVGGEGYIGQIVCNELVDKNHEVISYDNLIYGQKTNSQINKRPNFRFVNGDIRDSLKIRENLENVNAVIILAGLVGDPITKKYPGLSTEINQKGIKKKKTQGIRTLSTVTFFLQLATSRKEFLSFPKSI